MTRATLTVQFSSVVYPDGNSLDDPAESYHEAAKLHPATAGREMRGIRVLEQHTDLQASIERAGRRHAHRPRLPLPQPHWPTVSLRGALAARRSRPPAPDSRLSVGHLGTLLAAAGGRAHFAPSAGALYPLELYLLAQRIEAVPAALYHYDPCDHCLERLDLPAGADLNDALVEPTVAENAAALVFVTGVFWRSRFKYGQRGYRFTLLEAGHAVQNLLLVAAGLELTALPLGGYFDGVVDRIIGLDGVNESAIYGVALGEEAAQ